ncbi:MAG: hypothetical protein DRN88_02995 [Candidatus Hydrothermarchaeota archaeon]|nr:MAG: hypothetical protein DRN88_02995 [Candidatus Hydrothermarchaeota archaeon]
MKPLGKPYLITKTGNILVRVKETPPLYSTIATKKGKIGKVIDIIGSSSNPYLVIKPKKKVDLEKIENETLYLWRKSRWKRR